MERIESAANAKIKWTARLRQRKYREKENCFIVEGTRLAEMAAASDWPLILALVTKAAAQKPRVECILTQLAGHGCPIYEVSEAVMAKAAATVTPQGLLIVMKRRLTTLEELPKMREPALWAVLDGVQDPGNAGTILRTADAVGATAIITLTETVDVFSDKAVRATMGSLFYRPSVAGVTAAEFIRFSQAQEVQLFAAVLDKTAKPYFMADYRLPTAVVFGGEGGGVSPEILATAQRIYIPMAGAAESVNVGVAAAVILYESLRQRRYGSYWPAG